MQRVKIINKEDPHYGEEGLAKVMRDGVAVFFNGDPRFSIYFYPDIKVVGSVSVYDATRLGFNQMRDETFPILELVNRVRSITGREYLMDGTILRRLRELREDGLIDYEVADKLKAKYRKICQK